jgi:hypothetical protein
LITGRHSFGLLCIEKYDEDIGFWGASIIVNRITGGLTLVLDKKL